MPLVANSACFSEDDIGSLKAHAVYGEDTRVELYDHPDPAVRELGRRSVFGMVRESWFTRWNICDPDNLQVDGTKHGEFYELCPEVKFWDQPRISLCSATLIDEDLVLTARHCVATDEECEATRFIGGLYYEDETEFHHLTRNDVFHCKKRVAIPGNDAVIIQLDRPVGPNYAPAAVASTEVVINDSIKSFGFPLGIPMKVADSCKILGIGPSVGGGLEIHNNCESFDGNSGAGAFSEDNELFGVLSSGAGSIRPAPGRDCKVLTRYTEDGYLEEFPDTEAQLASFVTAKEAIDALCAQDWPSSLCGTDAVCGDDLCTGAETFANCAEDCEQATCGDGVCTLDEDFSCPTDCGDRDEVAECNPLSNTDAGISVGDSDAGITPSEENSGCGCQSGRANTTGRLVPFLVLLLSLILRRLKTRWDDETASTQLE